LGKERKGDLPGSVAALSRGIAKADSPGQLEAKPDIISTSFLLLSDWAKPAWPQNQESLHQAMFRLEKRRRKCLNSILHFWIDKLRNLSAPRTHNRDLLKQGQLSC
jgi:hypothetical protein